LHKKVVLRTTIKHFLLPLALPEMFKNSLILKLMTYFVENFNAMQTYIAMQTSFVTLNEAKKIKYMSKR